VHYWTRDFGNGPSWTWNNEQDSGLDPQQFHNTYGYFVEFDTPPDLIPMPEPPTLVPAGTAALIGLGMAWRRRRTRD
jgi:MYXO-CTERM domain-containing protein